MRTNFDLSNLLLVQRWSRDEAVTVLDEARRSGLSIPAFAARHNVSVQRLYWWRRRLDPAQTSTVSFDEVSLPLTPSSRAGSILQVALRSGHTVRIEPDFDESALRRLVRVLDDNRSC